MANSARIDDLKKKFDENPRRYFAPLANEYRKSGDPEQAIAICREFLPQQPGHMSGHIVYGQALFDAQQLDEAKAVFDTALTLDPENLIALRYLGDIARGMGDGPTARLWYQRVLDADPRNAEISALLTELADAPGPPPAAAPPAEERRDEAPATGPTGTVVMESFSLEGLTGSAPPETEPAPAPTPDPAPVPEPVAASAPPATPPVETAPEAPADAASESSEDAAHDLDLDEELFRAAADATTGQGPTATSGQEEPPEAPAPPADELLDLDELNLETDSPVMPGTDAPRPSLDTVGFDIERAGDGLLMPAFDAERNSEAEEPAEAEEFAEAEGFAGPEEFSEAEEPAAEAEAEAEQEPVAEAVTDFYSLDDLELPPAEPATPTPAGGSDPFATETMADLYRSQGHLENALRVYRQLLAQRPGDASLQATITQLEAAMRMTPPSGQEVPDLDASDFSFESDAGSTPAAGTASQADHVESDTDVREAGAATDTPTAEFDGATSYGGEARARVSSGPSIREFLLALGSYVLGGGSDVPAAEPEGPDGQLEAGPAGAGEVPAADDTPESLAGVEAGEPAMPEAAASPEPAAAPEPEAEPAPVERIETIETMAWAGVESLETIADLDSTELAAGPDGGELPGEATAGTTQTEPTPTMASEAQRPPSAGEGEGGGEDVEELSAGGSIDTMFGAAAAPPEDQAAATTLAGAFGAIRSETPAEPMPGAPARRAAEELSLDSVFREQRGGQQSPEAQGFSFDKFFANPTPAMGSSITETPPTGQPPEASDDDIEQFNSWLDGLKKR